jgi:hypothetical protein
VNILRLLPLDWAGLKIPGVASKVRSRRGRRSRQFTQEEIRKMRADFAAGGTTTQALAKKYGMSRRYAYRILINGERDDEREYARGW